MYHVAIAPADFADQRMWAGLLITLLLLALVVAIKSTMARRQGGLTERERMPFSVPNHPVIEPASGAMPSVKSEIAHVRHLLGPSPRTYPSKLKSYIEIDVPSWMNEVKNDELWRNLKDQDALRRDGLVVWAAFIQANRLMFEQNNFDCPASVVLSPDAWFDTNRDALAEIAYRCGELKNTVPDAPELAEFANVLTNERIRAMGLRVPRVIAGPRAVIHTSILLTRKHMPKGVLSGQFFPVWTNPEKGTAIMVPAAYWPASLWEEWGI